MTAPVLKDQGLSGLIAGPLRTVASGLEFTEGPLGFADGSFLFQDIKAEKTYRVGPDGSVSVLREKTGAANGQTFDASGRIIFCEQNGRRVSRMNPDGSDVSAVVEAFDLRRLNSPNDIVCRSDGRVYFTDPPYGVPSPEAKELPFQAVFTLDPGDSPRPLVEDFEKPNGLAFSPDESILYVCDTARYHIRAFRVEPDGQLDPASDHVFAAMEPDSPGGPDGMKVDRDGRLYVAVAQGVWVYEPDGQFLGILATPKRPANLAWCGTEADELVITMGNTVLQIKMNVRGVIPPFRV